MSRQMHKSSMDIYTTFVFLWMFLFTFIYSAPIYTNERDKKSTQECERGNLNPCRNYNFCKDVFGRGECVPEGSCHYSCRCFPHWNESRPNCHHIVPPFVPKSPRVDGSSNSETNQLPNSLLIIPKEKFWDLNHVRAFEEMRSKETRAKTTTKTSAQKTSTESTNIRPDTTSVSSTFTYKPINVRILETTPHKITAVVQPETLSSTETISNKRELEETSQTRIDSSNVDSNNSELVISTPENFSDLKITSPLNDIAIQNQIQTSTLSNVEKTDSPFNSGVSRYEKQMTTERTKLLGTPTIVTTTPTSFNLFTIKALIGLNKNIEQSKRQESIENMKLKQTTERTAKASDQILSQIEGIKPTGDMDIHSVIQNAKDVLRSTSLQLGNQRLKEISIGGKPPSIMQFLPKPSIHQVSNIKSINDQPNISSISEKRIPANRIDFLQISSKPVTWKSSTEKSIISSTSPENLNKMKVITKNSPTKIPKTTTELPREAKKQTSKATTQSSITLKQTISTTKQTSANTKQTSATTKLTSATTKRTTASKEPTTSKTQNLEFPNLFKENMPLERSVHRIFVPVEDFFRRT